MAPMGMFFDQSTDIMVILLRAAGAGRRSADIVMAVGLRWWLHLEMKWVSVSGGADKWSYGLYS